MDPVQTLLAVFTDGYFISHHNYTRFLWYVPYPNWRSSRGQQHSLLCPRLTDLYIFNMCLYRVRLTLLLTQFRTLSLQIDLHSHLHNTPSLKLGNYKMLITLNCPSVWLFPDTTMGNLTFGYLDNQTYL